MKISPINNYILNFNNGKSTVHRSFVDTKINDTYGFSLVHKNNSTPHFCGFFDKFKKNTNIKPAENHADDNTEVSDFHKTLSKGLSEVFETDIPAQNFRNVVSPEEFKNLISGLTAENFLSHDKNLTRGIYCADLDNQTNFSHGNQTVVDILNKANTFAQKYYEQTGKDFIFAIADTDTLESTQHAVRILGENPEKFKHLKLVPAIKLTFIHKSPELSNYYTNHEMLIYGINPFSKNLISFVDERIAKRREMIETIINEVKKLNPALSYSIMEFAEQNGLKYFSDFTIPNLFSLLKDYVETKGDSSIKSKPVEDVYKESQNILSQMGKVLIGSQDDDTSNLFIKFDDDKNPLNSTVNQLFHKFATRFNTQNGEIISSSENTYQGIINCFGKEPQKPVMSLASPFYLTKLFDNNNPQYIDNILNFIKDLQSSSNGMLYAFESVSPDYEQGSLSRREEEDIKRFNNILRDNTELKETGGSFALLK